MGIDHQDGGAAIEVGKVVECALGFKVDRQSHQCCFTRQVGFKANIVPLEHHVLAGKGWQQYKRSHFCQVQTLGLQRLHRNGKRCPGIEWYFAQRTLSSTLIGGPIHLVHQWKIVGVRQKANIKSQLTALIVADVDELVIGRTDKGQAADTTVIKSGLDNCIVAFFAGVHQLPGNVVTTGIIAIITA